MITAQQVETWQAEVRDLRAEIERLRAEDDISEALLKDAKAKIAQAAAFLDELATANEQHGYSTEAADCRAMAAKLRTSSPLD